MPLNADLYLDRVDLAGHVGGDLCDLCHVDSLDELVERLRSGNICAGLCAHWPPERIAAFQMAVNAGEMLPTIPSLQVPRPTEAGMITLNETNADTPVLVTSNSQLTHEILLAVLSTATAPMRLLSVDTGGHTLDMSLVFETFTTEAISAALETEAVDAAARIVLPGLASSLAGPLAASLGRSIEVGPICAAELPLFFGPEWLE